jgi:ABC-type sugar transport system permease subunit
MIPFLCFQPVSAVFSRTTPSPKKGYSRSVPPSRTISSAVSRTAMRIPSAGEKTSQMFQVTSLAAMLQGLNLPSEITSFIVNAANNIFGLMWQSGIQIVLFLAGLQTIPGSLYEAASIDGGTKWEIFWKVTFPMITPIMLVNLVYTITDSFTATNNGVMKQILSAVQDKLDFDYSAALAWLYFLIIIVILGVVILIVNKKVTYLD